MDTRHVGDIGNILTPSNRVTDLDFFEMYRPYLTEENGIIGKAFVVHANYLGNFEKNKSQKIKLNLNLFSIF